jgi:Uma2 family endonuclease
MEGTPMGRTVATAKRKLTYDDYVLFPDDGKRHELIDGEHYVTPSPNLRHQRVLLNLTLLLGAFVRERGVGHVFFAPLDTLLSPHDVVEPDLLFVSNARAEILTAPNVKGAPDLLVEVLSPSNRRHDEVLKLGLYERAGATEYWLVDPEAETVKVFRRSGERFARAELYSRRDGDVVTTPLLPGLDVALEAVFAD